MRSPRRKYLIALALAAALVAVVGGLVFHRIAVQARQSPQLLTATQSKTHVVAWERTEIPVNPVNSRFRLSLPAFSADTDWVVGVRPIKKGESEKMSAGVVTWEDAADKGSKVRGMGMKRVSSIESYPQTSASVVPGVATFSNTLKSDQTLVIYLEVTPSTMIELGQNGNEMVLKASEGASIVFDGIKERETFDSPASFLSEVHVRKLRKEAKISGSVLKETKEPR